VAIDPGHLVCRSFVSYCRFRIHAGLGIGHSQKIGNNWLVIKESRCDWPNAEIWQICVKSALLPTKQANKQFPSQFENCTYKVL
jgi:hypothetical protein